MMARRGRNPEATTGREYGRDDKENGGEEWCNDDNDGLVL